MAKQDWRLVDLEKGVQCEPTPDGSRIVLWLPGTEANGFLHWERISNVPGAEVSSEQGLCVTQATAMAARQRVRGLLGKLLQWLWTPTRPTSWLLPQGGMAEQVGERQTGRLLVWAEKEDNGAVETIVRARWEHGAQVRKVGKNIFMVTPTSPGQAAEGPTPASVPASPREQAEQLLAEARMASDRRVEATALTDLGVALTRSGEGARAVAVLEEALTTAKISGDRWREGDARTNLSVALVGVGQAGRAQELLAQELAYARETKDRHEEKLVLTYLASALAKSHNFIESLTTADHALCLARELGDRHHEADLLWFQAIQHAELGHTDLACGSAQAAIDALATLRSPHLGWLREHLKKYRATCPQSAVPGGAPPGGYYTGPTAVAPPPPVQQGSAGDPSILRAAITAVHAQTEKPAPGTKTVAASIHKQRLDTCGACAHHTGARCRISGSFTSGKAWLAHETCPLGKWVV